MPAHTPAFTPAMPALKASLVSLALLCSSAWATPDKVAPRKVTPTTPTLAVKPPINNSNMDAPLFYQVLIAEIQANAGDAGSAYQLYLEAARRQKDAQLYQRAVEIALRARAGEQALTAAKAWRQALPQSRPAAEFTAQILIALGRTTELAGALRGLIQLTPTPQQPQVLAGLPRMLARINDKQATAGIIDEATETWRSRPHEQAEAWAASSEGWLRATNLDKAREGLQRAIALKPDLPVAGLLAIDMMKQLPDSEAIVRQQLQRRDASPVVRLAYARQLTLLQRYSEAEPQLETLVREQPDQMGHWLLLAAIRLELKKPDQAEAALQPVLALAQHPTGRTPETPPAEANKVGASLNPDLEQAYLLMAQAADLRGKTQTALDWMERADPRHEKLLTQSQRARLLIRLDRVEEARAIIRAIPEGEPRDAVLKFQTEAQILRDARRWQDAYDVLREATQRFPDEADLLYDRAMMAERLQRHDDMERLLKTVMTLSPDNPNAFNALGYSLADRGIRLDEARPLIERALTLRPGDPFITDSLGWLEFRLGRIDEALRLLNQAWSARPDAEIAAHLGEVLWQQGQSERAREIWKRGLQLDRNNETLQQVLKRLNVQP
ncbi:MAG: tetratricopeptide repeat protein [Aquabacterium sp.]|uniref:tetratricopeptide repeat protein n=1 Tax=Aquabacterium sp. TaxID=1872578 RepID=UPI001B546B78|nr:tetratricopeptide repeat protein [Aquabacterium sp.]MBP7132087.1 tetratricopeptide repeat protein [Aquabacterium sp.]MBP9063276.1 tetratricopeptide repeat protein [Aquabacterium sp.]